MDKTFKSIILLFWLLIIFIFLRYQLYDDGIHKITKYLITYHKYSALMFVVIGSLRIFTLVPCTIFVIIAGTFFTPIEAVVLAAMANLLSGVLLFIFTKFIFSHDYQNKIVNKYPNLYKLIKKNNGQVLALGVSSPVVPSDIVCFFSILSGISFKKYILIIFLADTLLLFYILY